jgi:hypothetical protein
MSIKAYKVGEYVKGKFKILDTLKGTQPRKHLDKLRMSGYIIKKVYNDK